MTIRLTLDVQALRDPAVARALTRLIIQLGDSFRTPAARMAPAATNVSPPAPAAPAPAATAPTPPALARPRPAKAAAAAPKTTYAEFEARLSGRTLRFLQLLRERGTLTLSEVMAELDIDSPKAVGGITGAIGRWAPARGLALPYEVVEVGGERAWRWTGPADVGAGAGAPPAPAAEAAPPVAPEVLLEQLVESLTDQPRRFMEFLREKRRATTPEVLGHLRLARARALSEVTEVVQHAARQLGVEPYDHAVSATGDRTFLWPGTAPEAEPERPRMARTEATTPRVLPFRETPISQGPNPLRPDVPTTPPTSAGAPGVFKRNRAGQ